MRAFPAIACAGLALALGTGCGADSSSNGAQNSPVEVQTGSLSKAEFIKRADAICEEQRKKYSVAYVAYATQHEKQFWVRRAATTSDLTATVLVPNYEKRIEELASLGAPPSDKDQMTAFLRAFEDSLQAAHEHPVTSTTSLERILTKPYEAEQRYGLQGCVSPT
jgi:hypothetical protein